MAILERPIDTRNAALFYARFSLALIGVMWVYSFLNYYHQYPLTTFYQEWGTAALGLGAMTLLLGPAYWRHAEIPRIVLLPVGMMLLVVLQYALGKIPYFGQALLFALYLIWAAMLIMLGARLRELLGLSAVATTLAVFLLLGAELSALIGVYQHYQWHSFLDSVVTMKVSPAVFGNVAQPNHYADYLTLGLASLGLLYARGIVAPWLAVLLALPIVFVLPLTGSRELWFFLAWLVALAVLWSGKEPARRALLQFSLAILVGFGVMHLVLQLPWFQVNAGGSTNTVARMFESDVSSITIRFLHLWPEAARVFLHHPLLGAGFGEYAWEHFQMAAILKAGGLPGLYNNAHNLALDVAAEGGLTGLGILFGTLFLWVRQAYREERSMYHWWGYALLGVLGIHSLGEYPLWYAYFLGIAAFLLGVFDASRHRLELGMAGRAFVLLALALGAVSLQQLFAGYRTVEALTALRMEPGNAPAYYEQMTSGLADLERRLLLRPYADLLTSSMIQIDPRDIEDKLALNARVEHFVPIAPVVYRQAMLLAQNGDLAGAQAEMERSIWAYPGDYQMAQNMLGELAVRDPTHFNALLEFAIRRHEEYHSAVYAK